MPSYWASVFCHGPSVFFFSPVVRAKMRGLCWTRVSITSPKGIALRENTQELDNEDPGLISIIRNVILVPIALFASIARRLKEKHNSTRFWTRMVKCLFVRNEVSCKFIQQTISVERKIGENDDQRLCVIPCLSFLFVYPTDHAFTVFVFIYIFNPGCYIKSPLTDLFEPLLRKIYSHITSSFLVSSEIFNVF